MTLEWPISEDISLGEHNRRNRTKRQHLSGKCNNVFGVILVSSFAGHDNCNGINTFNELIKQTLRDSQLPNLTELFDERESLWAGK